MARALIFDCDGVLADTERYGHLPAFNRTFAEYGLPVRWSEEEYGRRLAIGGGKERMASRRPYSCSLHCTGKPYSAKVRLNAGRWPCRSVSARTPSQSKINARATGVHHALPALPNVVM